MHAIQLLALFAILVVYAVFDVFNKRNVPDAFAYASIGIALLIAFVFNSSVIAFTLLLALAIGALGHVIYRLGYWGAGDYFELVVITLILPIQPPPLLNSISQLGMPFILSVVVATGIAAIWGVPIYYLLFVHRKGERKARINTRHLAKGLLFICLYAMLLALSTYLFGFTYGALALVLLLAVPSSLSMTFEDTIRRRMVEFVRTNKIEYGDMIATTMIEEKDLLRLKKIDKNFGRLATKGLILSLKAWKKPLPVYKDAVPLAPFVLLGVILALLFGNLMLFLI